MVFARNIDQQELTFGVSGKLIMNAVVLYDHQTDSLWSQFISEAVDGPLAGAKLELLPAQLTTWEAWREEHPDTLLLDKGIGGPFSGNGDRYASYYRSGQTGILGESNKDKRLPTKEKVVGLDYGATQTAYAFRDLSDLRVVNDAYDGTPVVITFDPDSEESSVFARTAGERALTFSPLTRRSIRDNETGSTWSTATGLAIEGPLKGEQLIRLKSFVAFWFAWSDFYPETTVYAPSSQT